jgi:flagellar biosynthetic protein FliR
MIPAPIKVLFGLAMTVVLYPALLANGWINPAHSLIWTSKASTLILTAATEVGLALAIGFTARFVFDAIAVAGNLSGTYMGLAAASQFDPHQETQTEVISRVQTTLGMLLFLAIDGHHTFIQGLYRSYKVIGIGEAVFTQGAFITLLVDKTSELLKAAIQLSAPIALSIFAINIVYGIISKAIPQINILVLSFAISAILGFAVLYVDYPNFHSATETLFSQIDDQMSWTLKSLKEP